MALSSVNLCLKSKLKLFLHCLYFYPDDTSREHLQENNHVEDMHKITFEAFLICSKRLRMKGFARIGENSSFLSWRANTHDDTLRW